jgi:hypothetical protein
LCHSDQIRLIRWVLHLHFDVWSWCIVHSSWAWSLFYITGVVFDAEHVRRLFVWYHFHMEVHCFVLHGTIVCLLFVAIVDAGLMKFWHSVRLFGLVSICDLLLHSAVWMHSVRPVIIVHCVVWHFCSLDLQNSIPGTLCSDVEVTFGARVVPLPPFCTCCWGIGDDL